MRDPVFPEEYTRLYHLTNGNQIRHGSAWGNGLFQVCKVYDTLLSHRAGPRVPQLLVPLVMPTSFDVK